MKQQALLFLLGTALAEGSSGLVNLKDGSFQHSLKNENLERLELNYSSRRNSTGHFGAGWCSILDVELAPSRGQMLELKNCDQTTRFQKAKTSSLVKGDMGFFEPLTDSDERLERQGQLYTYRNGTEVWTFDEKGQWLSLKRNGTTLLQMLHRSPTALRIQVKGEIMDLKLSSPGRIQKLNSQGQPELAFLYTGTQLTTVYQHAQKAQPHAWTFIYDTDDNMTSFASGGSPQVYVGYDRRTDRVMTVQGRRECVEKFEYETPEGPVNGPSAFSEIRLVSSSYLECKLHRQLLTRIENRFLKTKTGELLLVETWIGTEKLQRHLRFHPLLGSIVQDRTQPQNQIQEFKPKARPETRLASEQ